MTIQRNVKLPNSQHHLLTAKLKKAFRPFVKQTKGEEVGLDSRRVNPWSGELRLCDRLPVSPRQHRNGQNGERGAALEAQVYCHVAGEARAMEVTKEQFLGAAQSVSRLTPLEVPLPPPLLPSLPPLLPPPLLGGHPVLAELLPALLAHHHLLGPPGARPGAVHEAGGGHLIT